MPTERHDDRPVDRPDALSQISGLDCLPSYPTCHTLAGCSSVLLYFLVSIDPFHVWRGLVRPKHGSWLGRNSVARELTLLFW